MGQAFAQHVHMLCCMTCLRWDPRVQGLETDTYKAMVSFCRAGGLI